MILSKLSSDSGMWTRLAEQLRRRVGIDWQMDWSDCHLVSNHRQTLMRWFTLFWRVDCKSWLKLSWGPENLQKTQAAAGGEIGVSRPPLKRIHPPAPWILFPTLIQRFYSESTSSRVLNYIMKSSDDPAHFQNGGAADGKSMLASEAVHCLASLVEPISFTIQADLVSTLDICVVVVSYSHIQF